MEQKKCTRCGRMTLVGQSNGGRGLAMDVRLDPEPLDPAGELRVLRDGRLTWTRHSAGDVHGRSAGTILARPAGTIPRQTVHGDHACGEGTR